MPLRLSFCLNCTFLSSNFKPSNIEFLTFKNCILKDVNFSESDLDNVFFENCELNNTWFSSTY